jgi:hypothetical protein
MITAHKKNHGSRIPLPVKKEIALEAIKREYTIVDIARRYDCSRNTVYEQQEIALTAANNAFEKEEDVLFFLPVTKDFIHATVVDLSIGCKVSTRDIVCHLENTLGYHLAVGSVTNILDAASDKASCINNSYDLSLIKDSAADELYHHNKPLLASVDIPSRFCPLLVHADDRDHETWGIHLLDLQDKGFAPDVAILDGAKGLVKGHEVALPKTKLRHDNFHCIMDVKNCARFLKNKEASAATAAMKLYQRSINAKNEEKKKKYSEEFAVALSGCTDAEKIHEAFKTLSSWLQYDVLQLAGHPPTERALLFDFIVSEMTTLAERHPHRIDDIVTTLKTQRNALLDVANELNDKFTKIATRHSLSIDVIWAICYIARYALDGFKYFEKSSELEALIGTKYDEVEDEVLRILEETHRCSSMVENFNSRLRPYLDKRKFISQKRLALIQFYLNHKPFMRSKHERLKNKSPAEALTGKAHKPYLEMLGFRFSQRSISLVL